jgi:polysaccharide biosynthesis transport protein
MTQLIARNNDDADHFLQDDVEIENEKNVINLRELWSAIYRNRLWITVIIFASILLGTIATFLMTPKFTATSVIQIDQEPKKVLGTEQTDASASIQDAERFLKTQVGVLSSRSVAKAVAQELKLYANDKFLEDMDALSSVRSAPGTSFADAKREKVIDVLQKHLVIDLPPDSRVVRLSYSTPDPVLSARIANSFAENFIRSNLQRKFDSTSYARDFLRSQLDEAQARLSEAERRAVQYASRTRIIDPGSGTDSNGKPSAGRTLMTATLVELSNSAAKATTNRIAAEQKARRLRGAQLLNQPDVLSNNAIQQLLQERAEQSAILQDELQRRREGHPSVQQTKARISELNRQISVIAQSISQSARTDYEIAAANERALDNRVNDLKQKTFEEQNQSIELSIFRREADTFRQQYEYLLRRFNELNAEAGVQANNIVLIDKASNPTRPSSPNFLLNILLSLLGGLGLSALFVFAKQNIFNSVLTREDLAKATNLPVLGVMPKMPANADLVEIVSDPKSPLSEACSSLRSVLSLALSHGFPYSMAFVSSGPSEGKSTTCYALAVALTRAGRRVLVLDLDLRRPNQHNLMGVANDSGMSEILSGNKSASEVIIHNVRPNLSFIPAGPIPPNPTELLEPGQLTSFVDDMRESYDVVLIDSAPMLGLADAVVVSSAVEGTLYLVQSGGNSASVIAEGIRRLRHAKVRIFGVALTKFDAKQFGYGSSVDGSYGYQYESK